MFRKKMSSISELINAGRWDEALVLSREKMRDPANQTSVHNWFEHALILRLSGFIIDADKAHQKAMGCADYTEEIEGDFLRDEVIYLIRSGELETASGLINGIRRIQRGDPNRLACLKMVEGRLLLRQGEFQAAYQLHLEAAQDWEAIGDAADYQWVTLNLLHTLFAAMMSGHRLAAYRLLPPILQHERHPSKRWAATMSVIGGKCATRYIIR